MEPDEEALHTSLQVPDYKNPAFILQNLNIDKYIETNEYNTARASVIETIESQISFLIMCVLKGLLYTNESPRIYVFGGGYIGSCIVQLLIDCGCGSFVRVYLRDENYIKKWKSLGIKAVTKLKESTRIDLLLLCSNLASFSELCRVFGSFVGPHTAIISCVFGLQRRRVYNILKTPCTLRCFVEPQAMIPPRSTSTITPFPTQLYKMDPKELAARLLAGRVDAVQNLILIIENFYIIRGYPPNKARMEALKSVLGWDDTIIDSAESCDSADNGNNDDILSHGRNPNMNHANAGDGHTSSNMFSREFDNMYIDGIDVGAIDSTEKSYINKIKHAVRVLDELVGVDFQRELSKHIRIVDIPKINIVSSTSRPTSGSEALSKSNPSVPLYKRPLSHRRPVADEYKYIESALQYNVLVDIFKKDSKSNNLNDLSRIGFLEMEQQSESDDEVDAEKKDNSPEMDDLEIMRFVEESKGW